MADKTKIQYVDATWNPVIGCSKVHVGCEHCWAARMAGRFGVIWGPNGTRVKTAESTWKLPERWNRNAAKTGEPFRVMNSMCDLFEDFDGVVIDKNGRQLVFDSQIGIRSLPIGIRLGIDVLPLSTQKALTIDHLRRDFFRLVGATPYLTWLLFTKRPKNVRRMIPPIDGGCGGDCCKYRGNCWLIYSASDQATLDAGLPHLLACRDLVSILGLSLEPLLGPITIPLDGIGWVAVGGETGPNARPCYVDWMRSIIGQCQDAGVPCWVKQLGHRAIGQVIPGLSSLPMPDLVADRWLLDRNGADPAEWPPDLKVFEMRE